MHTSYKYFLVVLLALLAGSAAAATAAATTTEAQRRLWETLPPEYWGDYKTMLETPYDLGAIYKLARRVETDAANLSAEADYLFRIAIRLYERMLLIDPTLTQVMLRLGEIHYRLGSYVTSHAYLSRALDDPELPVDVREKVEHYLEDIDERLSPHQVSGTLLVGLRHQTNANAAPDSNFIMQEGQIKELRSTFTQQDAQDLFASLRLAHSYDPGRQDRNTLETRLWVSGTKHFDNADLDTLSADLTSGPRFHLTSQKWRHATLKPHMVLRSLVADDELFTGDVGAGVDASVRFNNRWWSGFKLRAVQQFHHRSSVHPDNDERDGPEVTGTLSINYRLYRQFSLGGALRALSIDADNEAQSSIRYGGQLNGRLTYASPLGFFDKREWASSLTAAWTRVRFDAPDAHIDPGTRREDDRYRADTSTEVPLSADLNLIGTVGYGRVDSNLPNFDYDNWRFSLGIAYKF